MSDERNEISVTENEVVHDNVTDDINTKEITEENEENPAQMSLLDELEPKDGEESDSPAAETNAREDDEELSDDTTSDIEDADDVDAPSEDDTDDDTDGDPLPSDTVEDEVDVGDLEEFDDEVKEPERSRKVDSLFDFIEIFVFTLAAVFIITSFFFRYSIVDGPSMQNTLQDGDKLLLSNFMYEPEYKDVVVLYSDELDKVIVKRVIATEGQRIKITSTDVFVDGVKLDEPYVYTDDYKNIFGSKAEYKYLPEGEVFEMTVPEGEIFVMGDHRNLSEDSRSIGTISEEAIIGKVILRFAPFDSFGKLD